MRVIIGLMVLFVLFVSGDAKAASSCTPSPPPLRYTTPHFSIAYAATGEDAVPSSDAGLSVTRLDGAMIGSVPGGDGIPDYVQQIGVYLEYAWKVYDQAGLRLPTAGVPVYLFNEIGAYGLYLPVCGEIYLETDLAVPGTTAVHELFHAVQYQYWKQEDFAGIPGNEQAFYKEATADWAMIQLMRPAPYVSWFADPDRVNLFQAGTSAAFFWIYYLEQLSGWEEGDSLPPGFDAMRAFLEEVALPESTLVSALARGPEEAGSSLEALLEQFTLANLLEQPLEGIQYNISTIQTYIYQYAMERGFTNALSAALVGSAATQLDGNHSLSLEGTIVHRYGAAYFELSPEMLNGTWSKVKVKLEGEGNPQAWLVELRLGQEGARVRQLSVRRITPTSTLSGRFRAEPSKRAWVVVYAPDQGETDYRLSLSLMP